MVPIIKLIRLTGLAMVLQLLKITDPKSVFRLSFGRFLFLRNEISKDYITL